MLWFDIEGTLTGNSGRGFAAGLETELSRWQQAGVLLGLATGRELGYALAVHRIFDMNGPIVAENGSVWWQPTEAELDAGQVIGQLTAAEKQQVRELVYQAGLADQLMEDWRKQYISTWYPRTFPHQTCAELEQDLDQLKHVWPTDWQVSLSHSSAAVDVSAVGINKGRGVAEIVNRLGFSWNEVGYVGDGWNDKPAFEVVGKQGGTVVYVGEDTRLKEAIAGYQVVTLSGTGPAATLGFLQTYML